MARLRHQGASSEQRLQNDLKHTRGVLSMARAMDPNSAGSQFFIMHMDAPHLDKQYAAFGKVTEGMDVVDAIARTPRSMFNDKPTHEQKMKTVTVETFGVDYQAGTGNKKAVSSDFSECVPADAPARASARSRGCTGFDGVLICGKRAVAPGHHKTGTLKLKDNSTELVAA